MRPRRPIKVLIVDDSALVRTVLAHALSEHGDIQVVGRASDPFEARDVIIRHRPNVIILDIHMPRMDGLTFLKMLRAHYPVPVIVCSGVAPSNSRAALAAIELGAVDVVVKPAAGGSRSLHRLGSELADKVRAAASAALVRTALRGDDRTGGGTSARPASRVSARTAGIDPHRYVIAVGASTGGTEAIKQLLAHVDADFPPVVIVQHMPEAFTRAFAERLDQYSALSVAEAVHGDTLEPGKALLARGGRQMAIQYEGGRFRIACGSDEPVNRHCPSVDVLFDSVARCAGRHAVGILLTGMGADGARGLLDLRRAGALTVAQDPDSCVVFGMPKAAVELGAVQFSAAPSEIPSLVLEALRQRLRGGRRAASGARP